MKEQKITVNKFIENVDELIASKYILAERKINDVLQAIAGCKEVYNVIAKSMINFDFDGEINKIENANFFKLPENDGDRLAFIFCFLSSIDDKKINLTTFITKYFEAENSYSSYKLFNKTVLEEFKRLIVEKLKLNDTQNSKSSEELSNKLDNFLKLEKLLVKLNCDISAKRKVKHIDITSRDLTAIISTFLIIIKKREIEYFYSFRVMLNNIFGKNKEYRKSIEEVNKLIDQIIRGIYE